MAALETVWMVTLVVFGWVLWVLAATGALILIFAILVGMLRGVASILKKKR